jgi:hypothetical protein
LKGKVLEDAISKKIVGHPKEHHLWDTIRYPSPLSQMYFILILNIGEHYKRKRMSSYGRQSASIKNKPKQGNRRNHQLEQVGKNAVLLYSTLPPVSPFQLSLFHHFGQFLTDRYLIFIEHV